MLPIFRVRVARAGARAPTRRRARGRILGVVVCRAGWRCERSQQPRQWPFIPDAALRRRRGRATARSHALRDICL